MDFLTVETNVVGFILCGLCLLGAFSMWLSMPKREAPEEEPQPNKLRAELASGLVIAFAIVFIVAALTIVIGAAHRDQERVKQQGHQTPTTEQKQ